MAISGTFSRLCGYKSVHCCILSLLEERGVPKPAKQSWDELKCFFMNI